MALKALEKLRKCAKHESAGFFVNLEQSFGLSRYKCGDSTVKPNGGAILNAIADEVEAEIASDYMRLPTGADGVPIHIGDVLELTSHYTGKWEVDGLMFDGDDWYFESSGNYMNCAGWSHAKSHTLEDVLREMLDRNTDGVGYREFNSDFGAFVAHYADEIRDLLEADDGYA